MPLRITQSELEAYLEEALSPEEMAAVEAELRKRPDLLRKLAEINGRRDAGVHSVGEIWRRNRISCPTRPQLGSYLLGVLDAEHSSYLKFHLEVVACRYCQANLNDLEQQQQEAGEAVQQRRTKIFQSTAGQLRRNP